MDWSETFTMSFAKVEKLVLENLKLRYSSCLSAFIVDSLISDVQFDYAQFDGSDFRRTIFKNITFSGEIIFDEVKTEKVDFLNIAKTENFSGSYNNTEFEGINPFHKP